MQAGVVISKFAKKIDLIIISVVLLAAFVAATAAWLHPFEGQLYASVYIDGEYVESIPLQAELKQLEIKTGYGFNELMILDNKAYVKESDCVYRQCVNTGSISRAGQSIVCATHGLVIVIEDEAGRGGR